MSFNKLKTIIRSNNAISLIHLKKTSDILYLFKKKSFSPALDFKILCAEEND
jgi:hypothetical protein